MLDAQIETILNSVRQPMKSHIFHKKFTYENYLQAHAWLDAIFKNGRFVCGDESHIKQSVCAQCGGACCSHGNMVGEGAKQLPTLVWNEHIYFDDPEFTAVKNGFMICKRQDKACCAHKLILCKIHPFYPARIHLLEEECDFSIYIASYSSDRKMCTNVINEVEPWQIEELYRLFHWLYGEFPENRLTYLAHFFLDDNKQLLSDQVSEKMHDAFFKGYECSINKIFRA